MFERFTEAPRRTLFFARLEASDSGSAVITPETILLGLLREPKGLLATIFATARVTHADVRQQIVTRRPAGEKIPMSAEIPFSSETKRAFIYASEEVDGLHHAEIRPEHLLLGLLREDGTLAASILSEHTLTAGNVREALSRTVDGRIETVSPSRVFEIDRIKRMVEELAAERDEFRRSLLVDSINERLDALTRRIEPHEGEHC